MPDKISSAVTKDLYFNFFIMLKCKSTLYIRNTYVYSGSSFSGFGSYGGFGSDFFSRFSDSGEEVSILFVQL